MRSGLQGAGAVGAAPGLAMLVPWPPRSTTRVPAAETATLPRSTNTPKTPALGPAKKRVPRTAIRPKGVRICIRAGGGAGRPVEQDRSGANRDFPARIHQETIYGHARLLSDPQRRIPAEMQR